MMTLEEEIRTVIIWCNEQGYYRAAARLELKGKKRKRPKRVAVFVGGKAKPANAFKLDVSKIEGNGK